MKSSFVPTLEEKIQRAKADPRKFLELLPRQLVLANETELRCFVRTYSEFIPAESDRDKPLFGLTFSVKDNISVLHSPVTCGIKTPPIARSNTHASIVELFLSLGAALVGSTSMDNLAIGSEGILSTGEKIGNPAYPDCSVLGSSGGSASSVAGSLVDFSIGSDSGGSVRIPAAACGICGWRGRSTWLSRQDSLLLDTSLDSLGIMTRTLEDLMFILDVLGASMRGQEIASFAIPSHDSLQNISNELKIWFLNQIEKVRNSYDVKEIRIDFERFQDIRRIIVAKYLEKFVVQYEIPLPSLSDSLQALLFYASKLSSSDIEAAEMDRTALKEQIASVLSANTLLLTPTLPSFSDREVLDGTSTHFTSAANIFDSSSISMPIENRFGASILLTSLSPVDSDLLLPGLDLRNLLISRS